MKSKSVLDKCPHARTDFFVVQSTSWRLEYLYSVDAAERLLVHSVFNPITGIFVESKADEGATKAVYLGTVVSNNLEMERTTKCWCRRLRAKIN